MSPHSLANSRKMWPLAAVALLVLQMASATDKPSAPPKILPQSPDVLVLKTTVRRVVVDVVVRGSDGKPVQGLHEKDFTILEDGKPQKVLSFDEHRFDTGSLAIPANAPALPPNVYVNVPKRPEKGPLFVLLFDMVNTEDITDQIIARQQLMKFIASKPAGTRFAVFVHSDNLNLIQGFTDDKDLLYAALDPKHPKHHVPRAFLLASNYAYGSDPTVAAISVLTHIAQFLNGIPGRKNLIWVSSHFPISIYARAGDPLDLQEDVRREFNELTRAQIAVYPLDVRGVVTNPEGRLTGAGPNTGAGGAAPQTGQVSSAGSGSVPPSSGTPLASSPVSSPITRGIGPPVGVGAYYADNMMENDIAKATGGRAFYSTNDLAGALDEMVEDGSNYYTLTYSPTNPNYDGRLRKIDVQVRGHKYQLEYRRTYYADDPDAPPLEHAKKHGRQPENPEQIAEQAESRPLIASLQHGAPLVDQLIFKTRIHAVGGPTLATPEQMAEITQEYSLSHRKNKHPKNPKPVEVQTYDIYYVVVASQITKERDGSIPLEFAVVAFDGDGFVLNSKIEKAQDEDSTNPLAALQVAPPKEWQQNDRQVYRAMQELVVPVTARSIRVAVRDTSNDRVGALEIPLPLASEPQVRASVPSSSGR